MRFIKAVAIAAIVIMVVNIALYSAHMISTQMFWGIIIGGALLSYGIPKLSDRKL